MELEVSLLKLETSRKSQKVEIDPIKVLEDRINQCIELSVPKEKADSAKELIHRAVNDLLRVELKNKIQAKNNFNHFVNKSLSTVEVLGLSDMQYKAARKLILGEIYACLEYVSKDLP